MQTQQMETLKTKPRIQPFAIVMPIWLLGILFAINLAGETPTLGLAIALIWPLPFAIVQGGIGFLRAPVYREVPLVFWCILLYVAAIVISSPLSLVPELSIEYSLVTITGFILCGGLWGLIRGREKGALAAFSLAGTAIMGVIFLLTSSAGVRFGTIRNPNGIGLIVLGLALCAFAVKWPIVRVATIVACLVMILATESRSALIGTCIAIAAVICTDRAVRRLSPAVLIPLILLGAVTASFYAPDIQEAAAKALALDDPGRGEDSGYSGRAVYWRGAYDLWLSSPVIGIGYRTHETAEQFASQEMDAHNGYLASLAETGLAGSIPLFLLLVTGLFRLGRQAGNGCMLSRIGLGLLLGYLFIASFERYLVNFGNPTSVLAILFLLMPSSSATGTIEMSVRSQRNGSWESSKILPSKTGA